MTQVSQIRDWQMSAGLVSDYERLLGAIGTEDFGATVRETLIAKTAGLQRIYLFEATGREHNMLQYCFCEPDLIDILPTYSKCYMPIDPLGDAFRAAPRINDVAMQRISPSDISSPAFRRSIFDDAGIVERVSIIQRGADTWRGINVSRHVSQGCFTDRELSVLVSLAFLALPMLPLNRERRGNAGQFSVTQFEDRFRLRFGQLTERERQVCARAAIGMSVEATALDLGIAKTSVLTYRRRAYRRLQISSPFELCSLVAN